MDDEHVRDRTLDANPHGDEASATAHAVIDG
jgi:hypothetical protein